MGEREACQKKRRFVTHNKDIYKLAKLFILGHVGDLVVYGAGLDAYCMLRAVLEEGFSADRLKLVVPSGSLPVFSNQAVAELVSSCMEQLGVKVVSGKDLVGMESDDSEQLSALLLREGESVSTLPCAALVYLHHKQVDRKLFKGMLNCSSSVS